MKPNTFARARAIFDEVVDLAADERIARLGALCDGDARVRGEVEQMLEEDAACDRLTPAVSSFIAEVDARPAAIEGTRVGDFTILRRVASGGMGTVFEARQEHPTRRVALKLLAVGLGSDDAVQRFRLEAEALARLAHPGIATIYASGTHGEGLLAVPWLAIEFVDDARTIVEFARERGLDARARVELLARVCDAVQHAHAKGVIHRDLKPGNVLVDRTGHPRVIDFGVARVRQEGGLATVGQLSGTPAYMSPEQWEEPHSVDTRSDVYSLGVVLFELLTGEFPSGATASTADSLRPQRDAAPRRLSQVDATLAGDLECIVAKALERDRDRRYETVAELAADLRRHLSGDVVVARPPTAAYRISRFVRRHRIGVAASAAVALALVGGTVASLIALDKARVAEKDALEAKKVANHETQRVRAEYERAEATVELIKEMLLAPRTAQKGGSTPIADVLASGFEHVRKRTEIGSSARCALLEMLGDAFSTLGDRERWEAAASEFVKVAESELGADHEQTWDARVQLAIAQVSNGKTAPARAVLHDALPSFRRFIQAPRSEAVPRFQELARLAAMCDERESGVDLLVEFWRSGRLEAESAQVRSAVLATLAFGLASGGRIAEASEVLEQIEPLLRGVPDWDMNALAVRATRAHIAFRSADLRRAILELREARDRLAERYGMRNSSVLRSTIDLAHWLLARGDEAAGLEEAQRAYEVARESLGEDAPLSLDARDALALALTRVKRFEEALSLKPRTLAGRERVYGRDHRKTIQSRKELAFLFAEAGRLEEAEPIARQAFDDAERVLGPNDPETASALFVLAQVVHNSRRFYESEPLFAEAAQRMRIASPSQTWRAATMDLYRARALSRLTRYEEAERILLDALPILRSAQGDDGRATRNAIDSLVELYEGWGKPERARETRLLLVGQDGVKSRPAR